MVIHVEYITASQVYTMVKELDESSTLMSPLDGDRRNHESQSTKVYPELGLEHRAGRYRPGR